MAEEHGVPALGADVARELMERAEELGYGKEYWPVLLKAIEDAHRQGAETAIGLDHETRS